MFSLFFLFSYEHTLIFITNIFIASERAFRNGSYVEEDVAPMLHQIADGYIVETTNIVLDGVPVALETWDVSSQCEENEIYGNSVRPLLATFYDVVILCYDVSNESTLKAVKAKVCYAPPETSVIYTLPSENADRIFLQWAHDAERYCTGAPTILLGLKTDLRMSFPSLRLTHLREPTQVSTGQVSLFWFLPHPRPPNTFHTNDLALSFPARCTSRLTRDIHIGRGRQ